MDSIVILMRLRSVKRMTKPVGIRPTTAVDRASSDLDHEVSAQLITGKKI